MPPLSEMIHVVLYAVLPALGVSALVMAIVVLVGGAKNAAALALSAGAALGLWLCDALTLISADSAWNRLPWAALAVLWVGRITRSQELVAGWFVRSALVFAIAWLVIPVEARKELDWLAPVLAALILLLWALLERVAAAVPGGSVPFCLAMVFVAAGMVLVHAGSARLMFAAFVIGSALAGLAPVAWWRRVDVSSAAPACAVMLTGLLLMGQQETFSDVPWYAFALPAFAPLLLAEALPMPEGPTTLQRLMRALLMVLLILIPLAVALQLAHEYAPLEFD